MKMMYEIPSFEIVSFESEDIITLSSVDSNPENAKNDNEITATLWK